MKLVRGVLLCVVSVSLLSQPMAQAFDEPAVNLGLTSFLDGIPPAGPGWYVQNYVQYYAAYTFRDGDGNEIPFPDPSLTAWAGLVQVLYQSKVKCPLSGGLVGLNVIIPYADIEVDYAAAGPFPAAGDGGFGDIVVGPFMQWIKMGDQGPVFAHRVELQCIFPTGEYDEMAQINPGANVFSFNPYWAGTLFLGPKASVSTRIHYLWNDTNKDPAPRPSGLPGEIQAGDAIHANLSAAYNVYGPLRLGLNAYGLKQLSETEVDGVGEGGSKERVLGIGPGAVWSFSKETHLFFNAYFESNAKARPEGERYIARFVHHF